MHSTRVILKMSWRELWGSFLVAAVLSVILTILAGVTLAQGVPGGWLPGQAVADLPMLAGALWGGVAIGGAERMESVFWLARPIGRLRRIGLPLLLLWIGLVLVGSSANLIASLWGVGEPLPGLEALAGLPYVTFCGLIAASMLDEKSSAFGLGFVLAVLSGPGALWGALALLGRSMTATHLEFARLGGRTAGLVLASFVMAGVVWQYWSRWAPLRTQRSEHSISLLLGLGVAVLVAGAWVLVSIVLEP